MIQRVVKLNIKNEEIEAVIKKSKQILPTIPQVKSLQVGIIENSKKYNLALLLLFESYEEIKKFSPHPEHREYVDNFLKPRMEDIAAYNIKLV